MTRKRSWFEAPRWGDLPVSGAYGTLGIMEDHSRLLVSADSGSGPVRGAMRNRFVLVVVCFLVTLGSLLYVGKESPAKQPEKTPKPAGPATSHQPTSPQPTGASKADHSTAAAQQDPVRQSPQQQPQRQPQAQRPQPQKPVAANNSHRHSQPERADRAPSERPANEHANGRSAPAGQRGRARGHSQVARQPGSRVAPNGKSAHRPTAPDTARHHPRPEHANRGQVNRGRPSRPPPQGPTPGATKPNHSQGNESTGKHRGNGSPPVRHGKPADPPGREHAHPRGQGVTGRPEQTEPPPEPNTQAGPKADRGTNEPAPPKEKGATQSGISPDRSPSNNKVAGEALDRQSPVRSAPHHPARVDDRPSANVRPSVEPSYRPEVHEGANPGHRPTEARSEGPARLAVPSSSHPPDRQRVARAVGPVRGGDLIPAASARDTGIAGGKQRRPVGELAQVASWTPFGSAKLVLDPLRDDRGSLIGQTEKVLRSLSGSSHDHSTGTLHKGSLTQRGPPLEVPPPLSLMIGGGVATGSGSSGDGTAPLFAVIAPCLMALLYLGRGRVFRAIFQPGTVPRLALERPG